MALLTCSTYYAAAVGLDRTALWKAGKWQLPSDFLPWGMVKNNL
jgi:hypothetical protein